jgi:hypothetical protein
MEPALARRDALIGLGRSQKVRMSVGIVIVMVMVTVSVAEMVSVARELENHEADSGEDENGPDDGILGSLDC